MSFDVLEKTYGSLTAEQQTIVYNLVISLGNMNSRLNKENGMNKDEKLALFQKFKGSLKEPEGVDAKKEYLEYLDERYGV